MDIEMTQQGRARFGHKVLNTADFSVEQEQQIPQQEIAFEETRFRRLAAPISKLVEKIKVFDESSTSQQ